LVRKQGKAKGGGREEKGGENFNLISSTEKKGGGTKAFSNVEGNDVRIHKEKKERGGAHSFLERRGGKGKRKKRYVTEVSLGGRKLMGGNLEGGEGKREGEKNDVSFS